MQTATASGCGINPAGVVDLIDEIETTGLDPHSLMVLRGGRVAAQGWWHPYRADTRQLVYSLSKSFTATAVEIAVGEGRFSLEDPIAELLGCAAEALADGTERIRVRHLLAMASGHGSDTITAMLRVGVCSPAEAVAAVLAEPLVAEPGTPFTYNQGCSYLLSAAIRHTTGLQLSDYLRPRLFDPLGIGPVHWRRLCDLEQGFSGLHLRTRDIAALGQLYLQQGRWAGRRLVPAGFVAEASALQVSTAERQNGPDWRQGYGFHFWQCRFGAFVGTARSASSASWCRRPTWSWSPPPRPNGCRNWSMRSGGICCRLWTGRRRSLLTCWRGDWPGCGCLPSRWWRSRWMRVRRTACSARWSGGPGG